MKHTISVLVENHAGVLSKVSGLFSRRGFNIESLSVGVTEDPGISRITIVVNGDDYIVEQVEKQLNKVIPVIKVKTLPEGEYLSRELCLIKVNSPSKSRLEIMKIAELMGANVVDVSPSSLTIESAETSERNEPFDLPSASLRTAGSGPYPGVTAIEKGSSVTKPSSSRKD